MFFSIYVFYDMIIQFYTIFCTFDQINAALVSIRDFKIELIFFFYLTNHRFLNSSSSKTTCNCKLQL